jgi:hypothetical protein
MYNVYFPDDTSHEENGELSNAVITGGRTAVCASHFGAMSILAECDEYCLHWKLYDRYEF